MPYLIYKINGEEYTYLEEFDNYREARDRVRALRAEGAGEASDSGSGGGTVRLIFAEDRDEAVSLLSEKRSAPILKEWEK